MSWSTFGDEDDMRDMPEHEFFFGGESGDPPKPPQRTQRPSPTRFLRPPYKPWNDDGDYEGENTWVEQEDTY